MTSRLQNLQQKLSDLSIDGLFITNPYNIFYLTGCRGLSPLERELFMFITKSGSYVLTDGRYKHEFSQTLFHKNTGVQLKILTAYTNLFDYLRKITDKEKTKKIGFESEDLTWSEYEMLKNNILLDFIPTKRIVETLRSKKDKEEQMHIQYACSMADACMKELRVFLNKKRTEKEISWFIYSWAHTKGVETAFDPIVAINQNTSIPHYITAQGRGIMTDQSIVLVDLGIRYKGYCSDITRMFFLGKISDKIRNMYEALRFIQKQTILELSKKSIYSEVDLFCREQIHKHIGSTYEHPHSTGHGVGLEIHEYPKVSSSSTEKIQEGQVITIEPGIYIPGKWGIRIEDTVLIKKNKVKVMTLYPKMMNLL